MLGIKNPYAKHHAFAKEERMQNYQYTLSKSPLGPLTFVASPTALLCLEWGTQLPRAFQGAVKCRDSNENPILNATEAQLQEYFAGKRTSFDLPLAPQGTEFQLRAWHELLRIPYGQTISYAEQAKRIGKAKAARAVGGANSKNPIGIIIPCHRVIGASGELTGFAAGLPLKKRLLALESCYGRSPIHLLSYPIPINI